MSQHDYNLADQSGSSFRTDLNNALLAIVSGNSGAEPSSKFAYMLWNDTSNSLRKIRNGANSDWVTIGTLTGGNVFDDDVTFTGATANVLWDKSADDLVFNDNAKAIFGTGSDGLEIYHASSNSYIVDSGTGDLYIRASDKIVFQKADGSETLAEFNSDTSGGCELYYNGTLRITTTIDGVAIPSGQHFKLYDSGKINFGNDNDLYIQHDNTNGAINNSKGSLSLQSNIIKFQKQDGSETLAEFNCDAVGGCDLYYNNILRLLTTSDGVSIGTSSVAQHLKLYDSGQIKFGNDTDLVITHDDTNGGITNNTGILLLKGNDIYLENRSQSAEYYARFIQNGSCELMYDGDPKLKTLTTGIEIPSGEKLLVGTSSTFDSVSSLAVQVLGGVATKIDTTNATSQMSFYNSNGRVGYIETSGSATTYQTSSDYRLKENEVTISDGVERLKTLKPYRFNFKTDPEKSVDGFFAHEVMPAVPEAVSGVKDGNEMQGLDYSKIVPLLTAALQEVEARVSALEGS